MREIIRAMAGVLEAGAARGGDVKAACEAVLTAVTWEAPLADVRGSDPRPLVVGQRLAEACALSAPSGSPQRDLADALAASGDACPWMETYAHYAHEPDMAALRQSYTWAVLVGPTSPLGCDRVKLGVTLQGPDLFYPAHAHQSAELYATIGGTGDWRRGSEPWTARPPGDFVVHPSGVRHAMQSHGEPLLSMFAWYSDIDSPVVIVRG